MIAKLELKIGDDRNQVRVAATFAKAIDRPLHLRGAAAYRGDRIGDRYLGIIVAMNSDRTRHRRDRRLCGCLDFMRQTSPVGIAQRDEVDPGVGHRLQRGQRIFRVQSIPVEEMLGVENDFVDVFFQIGDSVVKNLEVGIERNSQGFAYMQIPGLADNTRNRRVSAQNQLQIAIGSGAERWRDESHRRPQSWRIAA